jgi:hypothetical protein
MLCSGNLNAVRVRGMHHGGGSTPPKDNSYKLGGSLLSGNFDAVRVKGVHHGGGSTPPKDNSYKLGGSRDTRLPPLILQGRHPWAAPSSCFSRLYSLIVSPHPPGCGSTRLNLWGHTRCRPNTTWTTSSSCARLFALSFPPHPPG